MSIISYNKATILQVEALTKFHGFESNDAFANEFFSIRNPHSVLFYATEYGRIIGTQGFISYKMAFKNKTFETGRSERTLVDPSYRGKSIFENLMRSCINKSSKFGINFFWGAATDAIKAFSKCGFKIVSGHRQYIFSVVSFSGYIRFLSRSRTLKLFNPYVAYKAFKFNNRQILVEYSKLLTGIVSLVVLLISCCKRPSPVNKYLVKNTLASPSDINDLYDKLEEDEPLLRLFHSKELHDRLYNNSSNLYSFFSFYYLNELCSYVILMRQDDTLVVCDFAALNKNDFSIALNYVRQFAVDVKCSFIQIVCNPLNYHHKLYIDQLYYNGYMPAFRSGKSVVYVEDFNDVEYINPRYWYITDSWYLLN